MIDIALPTNNWMPRPHQMNLWKYLQHDHGKRALAIWHRRSGKDEVSLHHACCAAMARPGNYAHCLPEYAQGRKSIWDAVNPHTGKRRIDEVFPHALRSSTREQDMYIRLVNGSTWQVIGSDTYNTSLVGGSLAGLVMSEYALANPRAWGYARPMLEENDGWAVFITTPRGRNHAYETFKHAQRTPSWFCELLTAEDTGSLTSAQLDEALAEYCALYGVDAGTAQYRQEYMADWQAAVLGSFYGHLMDDVRREGRITEIEPPPNAPVSRAWDLGIGDDTSIWFFSVVGSQVFIYDHVAQSGASLEWWRDEVVRRHEQYGWRHGIDYVPHDAKVRDIGTGRTRVETMQQLGLRPDLVPNHKLDDGINAVRRTLPLCVFHPRCEDGGISALEQYRRDWDDDKKTFRPHPLHNWASHSADSFRYMCMSWRRAPARVIAPTRRDGMVLPPPPEPRRGMVL